MNFLDIILIIPLIYGLLSGYTKGLISQLTGIIGGIIALLFGIKLSGWVRDFLLENQYVNPEWSGIIGFVLTVLGIIFMMKVAGSILKKTTHSIGLGFLEKIAGAILGILKAFLITLVLLFFFVKANNFLDITPQQTFAESKIYPYYQIGFEYLSDFWSTEKNTEISYQLNHNAL